MLRPVAEAWSDGGARSWRPILSGASASLVGTGLARFAYTPLIPALVAAHWFTAPAAAYLGAANLAGYLAGALLGRPMAARFSAIGLLRAMMLLATATFFACSIPLGFAWFFLWRLMSGLAGGVLMVLAAPSVLPHIAPGRRGFAGGAIFTGIGLGIAASGTLVPILLRAGLAWTWLGLGALALALTAGAWSGWPKEVVLLPDREARPAGCGPAAALPALYLEYGLNAVGLVPPMLFLADFVARGLGRGIATGADAWTVFGLGALAGPVIAGAAADRIGFGRALRLAFLIETVAVACLAAPIGLAPLLAAVSMVGAVMTGIVPLVFGRIHDLAAGTQRRHAAWRTATIAFALGQAAAAYGYSALFARTGSYVLLFALGALALLIALGCEMLIAASAARLGERG